MSLTIAAQTIASSPDGSETNSAAKSTLGQGGGGGCRFRASSTVTSSSSPCNHTLVHFAHTALEPTGGKARSADGGAFLAACCPVAVYP